MWLKCYLDQEDKTTFLNATAAALKAGYSEKTAGQIGYQNLKKLQSEIEKWLDEEGLSENALKQHLLAGLDSIETKFFQHEGKVTDTVEVIPWGIRKQYLELAMKMKKMLIQDNVINIGASTMAMVVEAIQGMKNGKKA